VDLKYYLIKVGDEYSVQGTTFKPETSVAEVPATISTKDHRFVIGKVQGDNIVAVVDQDAKAKDLVAADRMKLREEARSEYIMDIHKEMKSVFGTTNSEKANSLYLTWQLMKSEPQSYSGKGLKDLDDKDLDTQSKVYEFAKFRVQLCMDYSIFLIQRAEKYKQDLERIPND